VIDESKSLVVEGEAVEWSWVGDGQIKRSEFWEEINVVKYGESFIVEERCVQEKWMSVRSHRRNFLRDVQVNEQGKEEVWDGME
jgi:hypothetical protein